MTTENNAQVGVEEFTISRLFDVPRDRIFKAWTDREQIMLWSMSGGSTLDIRTLDFQPGGMLHYCQRFADGREIWGKSVYREIAAPERIVLVKTFSDADSGIAHHPMSKTWPLEMLETTTFEDQSSKTLLTIDWLPINASSPELNTFDTSREGMKMGWNAALDQLADYLAKG